ncbi:hypothetical protein TSUD_187610 [Trifolium subterraneum]|uniref:BURP domain-containing protein n=1 Tax=Trifolium subterraneum TaxID=3900 RepID=A0A2Z6P383_TRISU|nr:hypothetical protein TSUD_187610 [Trifolium subterraneum]
MNKMMVDASSECERSPSMGETNRCVGSLEDMIDLQLLFWVVVLRFGLLKILFPYLLYYCHSDPKVRVYEADLLDTISKAKINHGVAICHLDTAVWSPTHVAFMALGSGSRKHWSLSLDL